MNTNNTKWSKWMRVAASGLLVSVMTMAFASQASARILFQDDDFHDIVSEGILINSDDGGDEDVTLQFGNDTTDATFIFDDGTGDMSLATPGGDFDFNDDNLTTTGGILFSGTSEFHMREAAGDPNLIGTGAGCTTLDELIIDTTGNRMYICTGTGAAGTATWVTIDSGSSQDFEAVFSVDGDDTLTTTNQDFTVDTGTADFIVDSNDWQVDANGDLTANTISDGTVSISGGQLSGLTSVDAATEDIIEGTIFDSDAETVTGTWTWADNVPAVFGTDSDVSIQYDEAGDDRLEITGTNADVYIEDDLIVDTDATVNGTLDANGAVTLGDNGESVIIDSDSWNVDAAGVASGFTGMTSTGTVNFSGAGAFRIRENADPASNSACTTLNELIVDTTDNQVQICTATGVAGAATWTNVADGGNATTLDGIDSTSFLRSDTSDSFTSGTLTFDSGTTIDVNGEFDASGATEFHMREVAGDPNTATTCTTAGEIILNTVDNRTYVCTGTGSPGTWVASSPKNVNIDTMTWEAEWPDVVVFQDPTTGNGHRGKLEGLFDSTNDEQYYNWTTRRNTDQDIDLRFRYELPADFTDAGDLTLDYRTTTALVADNSVQVIVRNDTDDQTCHTDAAAANAGWAVLTVTGAEIDTGCAGGDLLAAGDVVEVIVRLLADDTNSGTADVGTLKFDYTN